jgi:hypothetical protein
MRKILFACILTLLYQQALGEIRVYDNTYYKYIFIAKKSFNVRINYKSFDDITTALKHITKDYKSKKHPSLIKTYIICTPDKEKDVLLKKQLYVIGIIDTDDDNHNMLKGWYRTGKNYQEFNNYELLYEQ